MFSFIEPTIEHKDKAIELIKEYDKEELLTNDTGALYFYLNHYSYEDWLKKLEYDKKLEITDTAVPKETYFLSDGDRLLGLSNIRLGLNKYLRCVGGNIGYSIRPSERGKGYNKINLYLSLLRLQKENIKKALINCDKYNIPSSKTIISLGGKLVREKYVNCFGVIDDYIIDVDDSIEKNKEKYNKLIMKGR